MLPAAACNWPNVITQLSKPSSSGFAHLQAMFHRAFVHLSRSPLDSLQFHPWDSTSGWPLFWTEILCLRAFTPGLPLPVLPVPLPPGDPIIPLFLWNKNFSGISAQPPVVFLSQ